MTTFIFQKKKSETMSINGANNLKKYQELVFSYCP